MKFINLPGGVTVRDDTEDRAAIRRLMKARDPEETREASRALSRIIRRGVEAQMAAITTPRG